MPKIPANVYLRYYGKIRGIGIGRMDFTVVFTALSREWGQKSRHYYSGTGDKPLIVRLLYSWCE